MSLWDSVGVILHGVLQYILWLAPVVKPISEPQHAPGWWYRWWGWGDWYLNLDSERRPNQPFIERYIRAGFSMVSDWSVEQADRYTDAAVAILRIVLGYLPSGFVSFSAWLFSLVSKIGFFMPSWANTLTGGLNRLWSWLPPEIRNNVASWWRLFQDTADQAIDWARDRYEQARARVVTLFDWWVHLGHNLGQWWQQARPVLDAFRQNPGAFVRGLLGATWNWILDFRQRPAQLVQNWLGSAWPLLTSFASGPLRFYYDLWSRWRANLFDFLADPLEFLWERGEAFLLRKLE